jgi:TPP-dependent pyruvate/acetoin dehydrogenase alpha subunit
VHDVAAEAVERARAGGGPTLIEIRTVRLTGHYLADPDQYRSAEVRADSTTRDPIVTARAMLHQNGEAGEDELLAIEQEARDEVERARQDALQGAQPDASRLSEYLYV